MPKFRYSLDTGTTWTVVDAALPYSIPSTAGQSVLVEPIGSAVTNASGATVPAGPTVTLTPGDGQISIAWSDNSNGGAAITAHRIYVNGTGMSPNTGASPYVLTGLANGTAVSIEVSAINSVGEGPKSAAQSATPVATGGSPVLRFAASPNRYPNTTGPTGVTVDVPVEVAVRADQYFGGDYSTLVCRLDNAAFQISTLVGPGNPVDIVAVYLESPNDGTSVRFTWGGQGSITLADGAHDICSDPLPASAWNAARVKFSAGEPFAWRVLLRTSAPNQGWVGHQNSDFGMTQTAYDFTLRSCTNISGTGPLTFTGTSPSYSGLGSMGYYPILLGIPVSGDPDCFIIDGDSQVANTQELNSAEGFGNGAYSRFIVQQRDPTKMRSGILTALTGRTAGQWRNSSGVLRPQLASLLKYANVWLGQDGTNNFDGSDNYSTSGFTTQWNSIKGPLPLLKDPAYVATGAGLKPMRIGRATFWPRAKVSNGTTNISDTDFPSDVTIYGPKWDIGGDVDQLNVLTRQLLADGQIDFLVDFDQYVRADPFGDPATSDLYHRWANPAVFVADNTHPGNGTKILANALTDNWNKFLGAPVQQRLFIIPGVSLNEGNSGNTPYTFTVHRTGGDTSTSVTLNYAVTGTTQGVKITYSDAATASDFAGGAFPSGTVTIPAGQKSTTLAVNVAGDTAGEADRVFAVTISNPPAGYVIEVGKSYGRIVNDDGAPAAWTPNAISSAISGWWDASDETTLTKDSGTGAVSEWRTKAGPSRSATQATAGARPIWSATARNSLPGITFDGVDDTLAFATTGLPSGTAESASAALAYSTSSSKIVLGYGGTTSGSARRMSTGAGGTPSISFVSSTVSAGTNSALWTNKDVIFLFNVAGNSSTPTLTGSTNGNYRGSFSGTVPTNMNTTLDTGSIGSQAQTTNFFAGVMQELFLFNRPLTQNEMNKLEGYLAHKWGVLNLLPTAHPYKTNPPTV